MKNLLNISPIVLLLLILKLLAGLVFTNTIFAQEYKEISWDDLMPEDWVPEQVSLSENLAENMMTDLAQTIPAPVVKGLNKQNLKISGFMLPIKYNDSSVSEFLLVPYLGACIHTPSPPENQMIYVVLSHPFETSNLWEPISVSGLINTKTSLTEYATTGYYMENAQAERYIY